MAHWQRPGVGDVGAYQVSGVPYVTNVGSGNTKIISFKFVTSEITLSVAGTATVDFQDATSGGPATMTLTSGVHTFRVRAKKMKIVAAGGAVGVCAALTAIDSHHYTTPDLDDFGTG